MTNCPTRCLILACGNSLRGDDGVGPWLAEWAEDHFRAREDIRVVSRQQWTPDLAEDVANAESVVFVDGAIDLEPGLVRVVPVEAAPNIDGLTTHHLGAAELLALARALYTSLPARAVLLTVGAGSIELGEEFSAALATALPSICRLFEETVLRLTAQESALNS